MTLCPVAYLMGSATSPLSNVISQVVNSGVRQAGAGFELNSPHPGLMFSPGIGPPSRAEIPRKKRPAASAYKAFTLRGRSSMRSR